MSSKQAAKSAPKKHTYLEMVQTALLTLNESKGSTRQEMWKCIEAKFPEADHKRYLIALRRLSKDGTAIVQGKNKQRFQLEDKFRTRALYRVKKGLPLDVIVASKATTDPVKKKMKAKKKAPKVSKAEKRKKAAAKAKAKKAAAKAKAAAKKAAAKAKKAAAKKSTKDKMKQKAKANKKTAGSAKSKAKVADKRKAADKKVAAKNKAN